MLHEHRAQRRSIMKSMAKRNPYFYLKDLARENPMFSSWNDIPISVQFSTNPFQWKHLFHEFSLASSSMLRPQSSALWIKSSSTHPSRIGSTFQSIKLPRLSSFQINHSNWPQFKTTESHQIICLFFRFDLKSMLTVFAPYFMVK